MLIKLDQNNIVNAQHGLSLISRSLPVSPLLPLDFEYTDRQIRWTKFRQAPI